jgi:hypothetical protein
MARRPSPPSSYGGDDKTTQAKELEEHGRHLHGVRRLVRPPGGVGGAAGATDLRTARPSPVRWTGSHASLGSEWRRWKRHRSHQSQKDGAAARLVSHPKEVGGARDGAAAQPAIHLHEAGKHPSPQMLEEEAGRSVASTDILRRQAMMVA